MVAIIWTSAMSLGLSSGARLRFSRAHSLQNSVSAAVVTSPTMPRAFRLVSFVSMTAKSSGLALILSSLMLVGA